MVDIILAIFLSLLAVIGLLLNLYLVTALIVAKQVTKPTGNVFLLHLGVQSSVLAALYLILATPSLAKDNLAFGSVVCQGQSFLLSLIHPLILWNIAGIHLDRFVTVAYPLRYASIMSQKKVFSFIGFSWAVSLPLCLPPILSYPVVNFNPSLGLCTPEYGQSKVYSLLYFALSTVAPIVVVLILNLKVVSIAKFHQFRIANALLGMAFTADHHLSEGAKARERQKDALKKFQGYHAVTTLLQLVGTLALFYLPFALACVLQSFDIIDPLAKDHVVIRVTFIGILFSPIWCSIVYGLRNKALQTTLLNFARKEMLKSEVQQEIRLRSPGGAATGGGTYNFVGLATGSGSARPSLASIIGHITLQMPTYIHRQLSMSSLAPESANAIHHDNLRLSHSSPSVPLTQRRKRSIFLSYKFGIRRSNTSLHRECQRGEKETKPKRPFVRHASDLTWKKLQAVGIEDIIQSQEHNSMKRKPSFNIGSNLSLVVPEAKRQTITCRAFSMEERRKSFASGSGIMIRRASSPCLNHSQEDDKPEAVAQHQSQGMPFEFLNVIRTASSALDLGHLCQDELDKAFSGSCSRLCRRNSSTISSKLSSSTASFAASLVRTPPVHKKKLFGHASKERQVKQNHQRGGSNAKPKITITRAPTINQLRLEFLPKKNQSNNVPSSQQGINKLPTVAVINEKSLGSSNGSVTAKVLVHVSKPQTRHPLST